MTALAVILLWAAYLVRDVLLLLYISGLLAIGFSPIVRLIERQQVLPIGSRRFPRWLAILILYLAILGTFGLVVALVMPPLVDQAQQLWSVKDEMFEKAQQFLIAKGLLREHLTFQQAVERAPGASGSRSHRPHRLLRRRRRRRRHPRAADDPHPHLLSAGRGGNAAPVPAAALSRRKPRPRRRGGARHHDQGQRVARRPAVPRRHHRHDVRASACGCSAFRSSTCSR